MIRITFLGTSAARPTVRRNVTSVAVQREGDLFLWDCGEGTQRQMMRFATGFSVRAIFFTHMHADHLLGLTGLLRTMGLQDRTDTLHLYGPPGSSSLLNQTAHLGMHRTAFPVEISELAAGEWVQYDGYRMQAIEVDHGVPAVGYSLVEELRLGRFDVNRAREAGVPEGPLFGRLHRGETIEIDGKTFSANDFVGPSRPGRCVVFTGDSRPTDSVAEAARNADLLIHDATFTNDEADRARATSHSTAAEAAEVAARAGVRELLLTHISARYSDDPRELLEEAKAHFPNTRVAKDGFEIEVGYRSDDVVSHDVANGDGPNETE